MEIQLLDCYRTPMPTGLPFIGETSYKKSYNFLPLIDKNAELRRRKMVEKFLVN